MIRSIFLILMLCCASIDAAGNPIQQVLKSHTGAAAGPIEPPNPLFLRANWWDYFSVEGEELQKRIRTADGVLTAVLQKVPQEDRASADALVNRIRANLRALSQVKGQKPPTPPIPSKAKSHYTVDELMDIFRQLRATQALLEEEREDVRQNTHAISSAERQLDTQLAAYLALAEDAADRLMNGLGLMADRTALEVADEQLRIKKERLEAAEALSRYLQKEIETAEEYLTATEQSVADLQKQVAQAESQHVQAQNDLHVAEGRLLQVYPDTPVGRAQTQKTVQQAILANVTDALARVDATFLAINLRLQQLLLDTEHKVQADLALQVARWQETLLPLMRASEEWQRASDREFKRANDDLLETPKTTDSAEADTLARLDKERINIALQTLTEVQRLKTSLAEAEFLRSVVGRTELRHRSRLSQWVVQAFVFVSDLGVQAANWIHVSLVKIGSVPVTPLGLLRAIGIIIFAWLLSRLVQYTFRRMADQQWRIAKSTFYTLGRLAHYVILALGLFVALTSLGLDFSNLALVAGALSVGIGFGLQSIVNNFLSGIIILFEKTLKIGDFLELESGYSGYISEINVRSTILRTNDGIEVVIPNSEIIGNKVVNWTMTDAFRRVHVPFSVAHGTDKNLMKKVVLEAADRVPHTLKGQIKYREPEIQMTKFGESGLHFELVVWVDARASKHVKGAIADYLWEIDNAFKQHGIVIPFSQYDIHIKDRPFR